MAGKDKMKNSKVNKVIYELIFLIAKEYKDFRGCYLYGSTIRKTFDKSKDIDIVAIFDYIDRNKDLKIRRIVCELMYKHDVYIDFHAYTLDSLAQNPIYYDEVINKGLFYAAA